ncbi:MAG: TolC family protein, partial [Bradymonadaceae bacterium]
AGSLPDSVGGSQGGASTRYEASLAASYEVDVWGRFRKRAKAAKLEARAVRADARALAMTMTSRVADAWFDAVAARRQLELIDRQIEASKELLELTKVRYRRGLAEELDVIQQEQNVESLRGERARAELSLETAEHRLAVLTGREPGEDVEIGPETLPDLPALPEPGVPADLLTRRPDVRAALVRLKAADRRTAAAVADRLPRVKLSTSLLAQATQVGDLLDRLIWSATGTVSQSIFEGGRLKAAQRRTESEAERRLYAYGQTVLEALKDVRDALVGERRQKEVVASLEREQAKAKEALASARAQFREGAVDYFRVLEALQQLQSVQRELVRARRDQISYRTSLCRAIGGSWADSVDPLGGEDSE